MSDHGESDLWSEDTAKRPATTTAAVHDSSNSSGSDDDNAHEQQRGRWMTAGASSSSASPLNHGARLHGTPNPMSSNYNKGRLAVYGDTRNVIGLIGGGGGDFDGNSRSSNPLLPMYNTDDGSIIVSDGPNSGSSTRRSASSGSGIINVDFLDEEEDDSNCAVMEEIGASDDDDGQQALNAANGLIIDPSSPTSTGAGGLAAGMLMADDGETHYPFDVRDDASGGGDVVGVGGDDSITSHAMGLTAEDYFPEADMMAMGDGPSSSSSQEGGEEGITSPTAAIIPPPPIALPDMDELRAKGLLRDQPGGGDADDDDMTIYPHDELLAEAAEEEDAARKLSLTDDTASASTLSVSMRSGERRGGASGRLVLSAANLSRLQKEHSATNAAAAAAVAAAAAGGGSGAAPPPPPPAAAAALRDDDELSFNIYDGADEDKALLQGQVIVSGGGDEDDVDGDDAVDEIEFDTTSPMVFPVDNSKGGVNGFEEERQPSSSSTPRQQAAPSAGAARRGSGAEPIRNSASKSKSRHHAQQQQQQQQRPRVSWDDSVTSGSRGAMSSRNINRFVTPLGSSRTLPFVVPIKQVLEQLWREEQANQHQQNQQKGGGGSGAAAPATAGLSAQQQQQQLLRMQQFGGGPSAMLMGGAGGGMAMRNAAIQQYLGGASGGGDHVQYQAISRDANADGTVHIRQQTIRPAPLFTDPMRFKRLAYMMELTAKAKAKAKAEGRAATTKAEGKGTAASSSSAAVTAPITIVPNHTIVERFRANKERFDSAPVLVKVWPHLERQRKNPETADMTATTSVGVPPTTSPAAEVNSSSLPCTASLLALLHPSRPPLMLSDAADRLHAYRAAQHRVTFGPTVAGGGGGQPFDDHKLCSALPMGVIGRAPATSGGLPFPAPQKQQPEGGEVKKEEPAACTTDATAPQQVKKEEEGADVRPLLGQKRSRDEESIAASAAPSAALSEGVLSFLSLGLVVV